MQKVMTRDMYTSLVMRVRRALHFGVVLVFVCGGVFAFVLSRASAADLQPRTVIISSPLAGAVTNHEFRFTTVTSASVGSVVLEYCANLPFYNTPCTPPTGLIVNASSIATQSGISGLSISAGDSSTNRLVLTRANSIINSTPVVLRLGNITNQTTASQSVFVRISTHTSNNGSGTPIDFGAVVYTTAVGIGVGGYVPPYLTFCAGVTVADTCTSTNGSLMDMGELSDSRASTATSQFAVATNDPTGYNAYVSGGTMTSGNEIIPALSVGSASIVGQSQFGINLRSNSSPSVGANISGIGTGTAANGYDQANIFRYNDGERIAFSPLPTNFNRFTVSYLVNVSEDQRPGVYASSYTFTAVASF